MKKAIKYTLMAFGVIMVIGIVAAALSDSGKATPANEKKVTAKPEAAAPVKEDLAVLKQSSSSENYAGETTVTIHVQVQNNSDELKDYVQVSATFYDKSGKIVGTAMGNTTNLAAGAHRTIDVVGMDIENSDHYEIEVADHPI